MISDESPTPSLEPVIPSTPVSPPPATPPVAVEDDELTRVQTQIELQVSTTDLHSEQLQELVPDRFDEYE